jgi:hypothetical protein
MPFPSVGAEKGARMDAQFPGNEALPGSRLPAREPLLAHDGGSDK